MEGEVVKKKKKNTNELRSLHDMKGKTVRNVTKGVCATGRALVIRFTDGTRIWIGAPNQNVCK
jgi:hypothetical protein